MVKIVLGIIIGLILGLVNAAGGTIYGLCQSNIIGADEGLAADFKGSIEEVIFHEKRDEKY